MHIPTDYLAGHRATRAKDPAGADSYIRHTTVGDPLADVAVRALSELPSADSERIVRAGMEDIPEVLHSGPPEVAAFFDEAARTPEWVDLSRHSAGMRLFFRNPDIVLGAMLAGVLVEGFSTNIANSFLITGRLRDQGVRRLQRNNQHLIEIFMPGGMERHGDGWKLSVRLRLVHARARYLLARSSDWNHEAWGTPISAAHMGFGVAAFSARLLHHMDRLGARISIDERRSFMDVWRYSGHLMGVPDTILARDEDQANQVFSIGRRCEPPPDLESIVMAHALVNSAPLVLGVTDRQPRRDMARYIFEISRALIGDPLADDLRFPRTGALGKLTWLRLRTRYNSFMATRLPMFARRTRFHQLGELLRTAAFEQNGIPYRLPDHVYAELSRSW